MPKGIYIRTEEWINKRRKRFSGKNNPFYGKHHTEETKKKLSEMFKGRVVSEERKRKISKTLKGRIFSKEHRDKISKALKGREFTEEWKEKLRIPKSEESKRKMSKAHKGIKLPPFTKEHKINLSIANKGKNKGKHNSPKTEITKERRKKMIFPLKDTKIEVKIQDFLTALKIEFVTHKYMNINKGYQCDILIPEQETEGVIIPQKTIIECDGDYFHMNPNKFKANDKCFKKGMTAKERWKLDDSRTKQLIEKGFRVIRLWEHEIKKMEVNDLRIKL